MGQATTEQACVAGARDRAYHVPRSRGDARCLYDARSRNDARSDGDCCRNGARFDDARNHARFDDASSSDLRGLYGIFACGHDRSCDTTGCLR